MDTRGVMLSRRPPLSKPGRTLFPYATLFRSDLNKALSGVDSATYKVLLSHDPSHWRREVLPTTNIDLTLSGHTHSMQFRIGDFSPSMWTYDEWGGTYNEGQRTLHVNTGTGSNVPFRFGAWPEITLITLKCKP